MDPFSALGLILALPLAFGSRSINSEALDPVGSYKGRPGPHCFLEIWDFSVSTNDVDKIARARSASDLTKQQNGLPSQAPGTIRFCIEEYCDDAQEASSPQPHKRSKRPFAQAGLSAKNPASKPGFRALMAQLRSNNPKSWVALDLYDALDLDGEKEKRWKLGMLSSTLLGLGGFWSGMRKFLHSPTLQWVKTRRHIRLELSGSCLKVFVSCNTFALNRSRRTGLGSDQPYPFNATERFANELFQLDDLYRPFRTMGNLKHTVLMQYYHANLNIFADFLHVIATFYTNSRQGDFDARKAALRQWNFQAIMADSYLYRQLSGVGTELTSNIESLLDIITALDAPSKETGPPIDPAPGSSIEPQQHPNLRSGNDISNLKAELQGCCKDVQLRLSKLSEDLEHDLKFLNLSRDMSQSVNVQRLTLLATVFLPLSLAAGVLSMQTRFKDLGSLLYDFFGVVILLGAVVALLLVLMWLFATAQELESRVAKYSFYRRFGRPILAFVMTTTILTYVSLVLASFCVGMFKDVVLGAKILGYGTLVAIFLPLLIAFGLVSYTLDYPSTLLNMVITRRTGVKTLGRNKEKETDPENGPAQEVKTTGEADSGTGAEEEKDEKIKRESLKDGLAVQEEAPNAGSGEEQSHQHESEAKQQ